MQTQMTSTKCRIDSLSTIVKWNIEFWRKWNAIELIILRNTGCFLFFRQTIKTCQETLFDWLVIQSVSLGHKTRISLFIRKAIPLISHQQLGQNL